MAIHWSEENAWQEKINAITHGLGFVLTIPAGIVIIYQAIQSRPEMVSACIVYSLSLSAMYLFSTLSHAVKNPRLRHECRALDQGTIYLLISGTFTPFVCGYMTGLPRTLLLFAIWIAAIAGFFSKAVSRHRINNMTPITYILLGWLPAMVLLGYVSTSSFVAMAIGGVLYSAGTILLHNDHRHHYLHAAWHMMVILASATHYLGILFFAILRFDGTT